MDNSLYALSRYFYRLWKATGDLASLNLSCDLLNKVYPYPELPLRAASRV